MTDMSSAHTALNPEERELSMHEGPNHPSVQTKGQSAAAECASQMDNLFAIITIYIRYRNTKHSYFKENFDLNQWTMQWQDRTVAVISSQGYLLRTWQLSSFLHSEISSRVCKGQRMLIWRGYWTNSIARHSTLVGRHSLGIHYSLLLL